MGYILVIVALVVVVPLLALLLGRKTSAGGGGVRHVSRGMTVDEPSSDQPAPGAPGSINQPRDGREAGKKLPPG